MSPQRVFKPSVYKRSLAWIFIVLAGGLHMALQAWLILNWRSQPAEELWSGVAIAILLLFPLVLGAALLRSYFVLTEDPANEDTIKIVRPFGSKVYRLSELGGFGRVTLVVNMVPLFQIRLYSFELKMVGAISLNLGDRAEVDQWFQTRLPLVVDEGSIAFPKPRYADARGTQRDASCHS
jgi:hypothetical protein